MINKEKFRTKAQFIIPLNNSVLKKCDRETVGHAVLDGGQDALQAINAVHVHGRLLLL